MRGMCIIKNASSVSASTIEHLNKYILMGYSIHALDGETQIILLHNRIASHVQSLADLFSMPTTLAASGAIRHTHSEPDLATRPHHAAHPSPNAARSESVIHPEKHVTEPTNIVLFANSLENTLDFSSQVALAIPTHTVLSNTYAITDQYYVNEEDGTLFHVNKPKVALIMHNGDLSGANNVLIHMEDTHTNWDTTIVVLVTSLDSPGKCVDRLRAEGKRVHLIDKSSPTYIADLETYLTSFSFVVANSIMAYKVAHLAHLWVLHEGYGAYFQARLTIEELERLTKNNFSSLETLAMLLAHFSDAKKEFSVLHRATLKILSSLELAREELHTLIEEWKGAERSSEIANIDLLLRTEEFEIVRRALRTCPRVAPVCKNVETSLLPFFHENYETIYNMIVREYWEKRQIEFSTWNQLSRAIPLNLDRITGLAHDAEGNLIRKTVPLTLRKEWIIIVVPGVVGTRKHQELVLDIALAFRERCIAEDLFDLLQRVRFVCVGVRGKAMAGEPSSGTQRVDLSTVRLKGEVDYLMRCFARAKEDAQALGYTTPPTGSSAEASVPTTPQTGVELDISSSTEVTLPSTRRAPSLEETVLWVLETDAIHLLYLAARISGGLGLQTSKMEALPLSPAELAILSVPSIVSDANGTCEGMIPGVTGYLVDLHDPHHVSHYVEYMWKLLTNPKLRGTMGKAAREKVLIQFGKENFHNSYEREMRSAIRENGKIATLAAPATAHGFLSTIFPERGAATGAGAPATEHDFFSAILPEREAAAGAGAGAGAAAGAGTSPTRSSTPTGTFFSLPGKTVFLPHINTDTRTAPQNGEGSSLTARDPASQPQSLLSSSNGGLPSVVEKVDGEESEEEEEEEDDSSLTGLPRFSPARGFH